MAKHPIWMPGMSDAEPLGYYDDLATKFGLTIDTIGPMFGIEALLAGFLDNLQARYRTTACEDIWAPDWARVTS